MVHPAPGLTRAIGAIIAVYGPRMQYAAQQTGVGPVVLAAQAGHSR